MKSTCTQPKWRIEHEGMFWKVAPSFVPTSNASNKSNEDSFFREGTRVIFVWFGALRMAFFIVSPVKQTVAIATFASQITIKTKKKKELEKEDQYLRVAITMCRCRTTIWSQLHSLTLLQTPQLNLFLFHTWARGPWERADLSIHIATHTQKK